MVLGVAETDHRVDLYSLGCVAYWLLTGKLVFEGESAMQVMVHHAHTPALRPSLRVELLLPAALEDLVMECLEKDPARRPPSAEILSARLEVVPVTPWTAERAERWASHEPDRWTHARWPTSSCRTRAGSCASVPGLVPVADDYEQRYRAARRRTHRSSIGSRTRSLKVTSPGLPASRGWRNRRGSR